MNRTALLAAINWVAVMKAPRYAGGHLEVFRALFEGRATVVAHWQTGGYAGAVAFAYRFPGREFVILTDYFGSCSGCDSWKSASDEGARRMITSLVSSARIFKSRAAARAFCAGPMDATDYPFYAAKNLDL